MLQLEKIQKAITAVEDCCGHCDICSPDCPIFIARRALSGLAYDIESMQGQEQQQPDQPR